MPPKLQPCWCEGGCWTTRVAGACCPHSEPCLGSRNRSQPERSRLGRAGSSPGSHRAQGAEGVLGEERGSCSSLQGQQATSLTQSSCVCQCP